MSSVTITELLEEARRALSLQHDINATLKQALKDCELRNNVKDPHGETVHALEALALQCHISSTLRQSLAASEFQCAEYAEGSKRDVAKATEELHIQLLSAKGLLEKYCEKINDDGRRLDQLRDSCALYKKESKISFRWGAFAGVLFTTISTCALWWLL